MLITYNEALQRFDAQSAFSDKETLKAAQFSFDFNGTKVWHSQNYPDRKQRTWLEQVKIVCKLYQYLDSDARTRIASDPDANLVAIETLGAELKKQESLQASRATNADIEIPKPDGLEYLPYQKAGIAYAIARQNTLIGDEMGLGKTIQAIGVSNALSEVKRILIVCPATLKLNWRREFTKWDVKSLSVGIAEGNIFPQTDVVIINYDILTRHSEALHAITWDILVVDECHRVKEPKTQRTIALLGEYKWNPSTRSWDLPKLPIPAAKRVFLTGTPIVNRPVELWPLIRALDPEGLGKYKSKFETKYCAAGVNYAGYWDKSGASNLEDLQEQMRSRFMIRRLKADVLKELPPKRRQVVVLESTPTLDKLINAERAAYDSFKSAKFESQIVDFELLSATRKAVAEAILPLAIQEIEEALEETDKLVVWAHHHSVIEALAERFSSSVVVYGETSQTARQEAVDRFQSDPDIKLFIGSIQAAGIGITLTAASNEIFVELDWVPGNIEQAEDRCHRIGQLNSVLIKYLVLNNSVSARMAEELVAKQEVIVKGLDTQVEKQMPEVGAVPKQVYSAVLTQVDFAKPTRKWNADAVRELAKQVGNTQAHLDEPRLDQATAKAIHTCLGILAARCDGAQAIDGAGFNKIDTDFGKKLASAFSLTPKQAAAGQKLVRKYQRQLPAALLQAAGIELKQEEDAC